MKNKMLISCLYINLIFNMCNNINIVPKNNKNIYYANDSSFRNIWYLHQVQR